MIVFTSHDTRSFLGNSLKMFGPFNSGEMRPKNSGENAFPVKCFGTECFP